MRVELGLWWHLGWRWRRVSPAAAEVKPKKSSTSKARRCFKAFGLGRRAKGQATRRRHRPRVVGPQPACAQPSDAAALQAGYVGFALDMFGKDKLAKHPQDAKAFVAEATKDPATARARFTAAVARLKDGPGRRDQAGGHRIPVSAAASLLDMARHRAKNLPPWGHSRLARVQLCRQKGI